MSLLVVPSFHCLKVPDMMVSEISAQYRPDGRKGPRFCIHPVKELKERRFEKGNFSQKGKYSQSVWTCCQTWRHSQALQVPLGLKHKNYVQLQTAASNLTRVSLSRALSAHLTRIEKPFIYKLAAATVTNRYLSDRLCQQLFRTAAGTR